MTPRYPGAVWMPVGDDMGPNNGPVAFSWHEAVTTGTKEAIAGWVNQENSCHAFVGEHGDTAQYKDFDRVAYGVLEGNQRGVVTIETWDNLLHDSELTPDGRDANHSEWDAGQCERIADMIAWADVVLGIPARFMSNTRESGHAPHRLGVPQANGAVQIGYGPDQWTSHPGKACPGDMRVMCLRDVAIPRAQVIAAAVRAGRCTWLPTGPVNLAAALARTGNTPVQTEDPDMARAIIADGTVYLYALGMFRAIGTPAQAAGQLAEGKAYGSLAGDPVKVDRGQADRIRAWATRPATGLAPAATGGTYTVQAGDTLSKIAAANHTTLDAIAKLNGITDPNNINKGQVLKLPKA